MKIKVETGYLDLFTGKEGKGETCIIYLILKVKNLSSFCLADTYIRVR